MDQLIARNPDDQPDDSPEVRATPQGRSLAAEARATRERERAIDEARERAERISRSLEGRPHGDSAALIREDRGR